MEEKNKLFKVEQYAIPEWGASVVEWTRYFLAENEGVVRQTVHERFGKPRYYSGDRVEVTYIVTEVPFETLDRRVEISDDDEFY
jgi:hypothetical protein